MGKEMRRMGSQRVRWKEDGVGEDDERCESWRDSFL